MLVLAGPDFLPCGRYRFLPRQVTWDMHQVQASGIYGGKGNTAPRVEDMVGPCYFDGLWLCAFPALQHSCLVVDNGDKHNLSLMLIFIISTLTGLAWAFPAAS